MTILQWTLFFCGILMSAAGSFFLKIGAMKIHYDGEVIEAIRQAVFNWAIILGVMMYFIPVVIWIFLLKKIELSFLQPLFSLSYIITPVVAMLFLSENVSLIRWAGIFIIIFGVIVVARS